MTQQSALKRVPIIEAVDAAYEEFNNQQLKIFWLPDEISVDKDVQDVLVNFTPAEKHGVITVLKLFSIYEDYAGNEWWGGRYKEMNITNTAKLRMASTFSMFELAVHAPFYNKINELLHLNTPEFYNSYVDNPYLKARIDHIGEIIEDPDPLKALAVFSFVEGVILYSNFAFLKHFQSNGKNKLVNVVRGINFSLRDESCHQQAAAYEFRQRARSHVFEPGEWDSLKKEIYAAAAKIVEHEIEVIRMIFEKGTIEGITAKQLINFVHSRVNECLADLGLEKMYEVTYNPIADWFYKAINDFKFVDFFAGVGNEYTRDWDSTKFTWNNND